MFFLLRSVHHHPSEKFFDPTYLEDLFYRDDAPCYPPYMQGLGYVLSRDLVILLASMSYSLKVYINEDMMVGTWLIGHKVW